MRTVIPIRQVADQSEAELVRDGWEKQTTLGEPRLSEVAQNYRSMGYEVHVQSFRAADGCTTCFDTGQELGQEYGTVWIRRGAGEREDDELFD